MKYFAYSIIFIVTCAVIGGFFVVGSPREERLRRFDERRIDDLQMIQSEIVNFWQAKGVLPKTLDVLNDDIRGVAVPRDPETGLEYEYSIKGELTFELCAKFNLPSRQEGQDLVLSTRSTQPSPDYISRPNYYGPESWQHEAGLACFERTIDPDIYKPIK